MRTIMNARLIKGKKEKTFRKVFNTRLNDNEMKRIKIELLNRDENVDYTLNYIQFSFVA